MKNYYANLEWKKYKDLIDSKSFKELDKYADHSFDNGISIRISTGEMAHTNSVFNYEMVVNKPGKKQYSIPRLNKHGLAVTMERLEYEVIEE